MEPMMLNSLFLPLDSMFLQINTLLIYLLMTTEIAEKPKLCTIWEDMTPEKELLPVIKQFTIWV